MLNKDLESIGIEGIRGSESWHHDTHVKMRIRSFGAQHGKEDRTNKKRR